MHNPIHYPTCRVWVDGVRLGTPQRCTCPRRWLIRSDRSFDDGHIWSVFRLQSNGNYELFLRSDDLDKALRLVDSMVVLENAIRR